MKMQVLSDFRRVHFQYRLASQQSDKPAKQTIGILIEDGESLRSFPYLFRLVISASQQKQKQFTFDLYIQYGKDNKRSA
jgi:hypothetical protein